MLVYSSVRTTLVFLFRCAFTRPAQDRIAPVGIFYYHRLCQLTLMFIESVYSSSSDLCLLNLAGMLLVARHCIFELSNPTVLLIPMARQTLQENYQVKSSFWIRNCRSVSQRVLGEASSPHEHFLICFVTTDYNVSLD